jgi:hypothetical protein
VLEHRRERARVEEDADRDDLAALDGRPLGDPDVAAGVLVRRS